MKLNLKHYMKFSVERDVMKSGEFNSVTIRVHKSSQTIMFKVKDEENLFNYFKMLFAK